MKKVISLIVAAILALGMCTCGAQPPEATAPIEPTNQIQPTIEPTAASVGTITPADIIDSVEPTVRPNIWVHTAYPSRETVSVEVRLQVLTDNGTIEYIDLKAQAVEYTNDWAEPLVNLVNGVNPSDIQEIWVRSEEFNINRVNCCKSYSSGDDGWFKVSCFHEHPYEEAHEVTYQLVASDPEATASIYATLFFMD